MLYSGKGSGKWATCCHFLAIRSVMRYRNYMFSFAEIVCALRFLSCVSVASTTVQVRRGRAFWFYDNFRGRWAFKTRIADFSNGPKVGTTPNNIGGIRGPGPESPSTQFHTFKNYFCKGNFWWLLKAYVEALKKNCMLKIC